MQRHTVLVPIDFSRASKVGLSLGKCLANQYGFKLSLLHIFPYAAHHPYIAPVGWMVSELRENALKDLAHLKKSLSPNGSALRSSLIDAKGDIAEQIIERAGSENAAIILAGTHSKDGVDRFVVGSVTETLLRCTDRPVLTVGPTVKSYAGRKIQHLVFATDLTERSMAPLPMLKVFVQRPVKLTVLHVTENDRETARGWESSARSALLTALPPEKVESLVEFQLIEGKDAAQEVTSYLKFADADLLLIGMHRSSQRATQVSPRTGFRMVMAAPCGVLSVCRHKGAPEVRATL